LIDGKDQLLDINAGHKAFSDLVIDADKLNSEIQERKQLTTGNLKKEDIDDYNSRISKLDQRYEKVDKRINNVRFTYEKNRQKLSDHGLEGKIDRRKEELDEI
jgi:ABC-type phosphate transport system auxiliary subunit